MIKSMMMEMWFSRSSQKSSQSHPRVVPESLQSPITKNTNPITDSLSFCDWSIPCRVASLLFAVYSCKENLLMSRDRITYPSAQVNAFELKRDSYLWLISDLMRGSRDPYYSRALHAKVLAPALQVDEERQLCCEDVGLCTKVRAHMPTFTTRQCALSCVRRGALMWPRACALECVSR